MSEFKISDEQMDAIAGKILEAWLTGDVPYEVKNAITKAVCTRLEESGEWELLAEAIATMFSKRRREIAEKIVAGLVEQLARGIGDATREILAKLSKRLGDVRVY